MSRLTEFTKRIEQFEAAEQTAGSLQDINAIKMQQIRKRFEKNRTFYDELRDLYRVVHASAMRVAEKPKAERVLFVAVTSDRRLAGTLTRDIVAALAVKLREQPAASSLVIGRVGWQYFAQTGLAARGRQVVIAGDMPSHEEFALLLRRFAQFDRVLVYFARFINPFRQEVALEDITQYPDEREEAADADAESYFFEPEVPAMLEFFDSQVRYILFERVMLESDLARTAARFSTMVEAQEEAHRAVRLERTRRMRELAASSNQELLETFAGYQQWRHL